MRIESWIRYIAFGKSGRICIADDWPTFLLLSVTKITICSYSGKKMVLTTPRMSPLGYSKTGQFRLFMHGHKTLSETALSHSGCAFWAAIRWTEARGTGVLSLPLSQRILTLYWSNLKRFKMCADPCTCLVTFVEVF